MSKNNRDSSDENRYFDGLDKAQKIILDSESKFKRLFENSQIPIWNDDFTAVVDELEKLRADGVTDLKAHLAGNPDIALMIARKIKVVEINDAALQLFKAESVEQFNELLARSFERGAVETFGEALCAMWEGKDSFSSEIRFFSSEDKEINAIVSFRIPANLKDFSTMPISIIDITERLQLQKENIRKAQLASLGEISAKLAHEVNNPLSGIVNYAQMLQNNGNLDGQDAELLERIVSEGERIVHIMKGMLNFSYDSGDVKSYKDLSVIVDDVVTLSTHMIIKDGIRLDLDIPEDLPKVFCNAQQIQQVILNVIKNACQAMAEGLIEGESEGVIRISGESAGSKEQPTVKLTIQNNGPNIPAEIIENIMSPFFTTKPDSQGTGLGLSICHDIMSEHNGEFSIESAPGDFTKMIMILPA